MKKRPTVRADLKRGKVRLYLKGNAAKYHDKPFDCAIGDFTRGDFRNHPCRKYTTRVVYDASPINVKTGVVDMTLAPIELTAYLDDGREITFHQHGGLPEWFRVK